MSNLTKRIDALEKRRTVQRGFLVLWQDLENRDRFTTQEGETYTDQELEALAAQGWQVIRVVYDDDWRGDREQSPSVPILAKPRGWGGSTR